MYNSAEDVKLVYGGYPAWVGYAVGQPDGTVRSEQDGNAGKWSTDAGRMNVYR